MSETMYRYEISGDVGTRDEMYALFEAMDYHEWFNYDSKQEMKNRGVYEALCWDEMLEVMEK